MTTKIDPRQSRPVYYDAPDGQLICAGRRSVSPNPRRGHTVFRWLPQNADYAVGDNGEVWSFKFGRWKLLKPSVRDKGYYFVAVRINGRIRAVGVHCLVLWAFYGPPPPDRPLVLHWDDNPANNNLTNLRYGSPADNGLDRQRLRETKFQRLFDEWDRGPTGVGKESRNMS